MKNTMSDENIKKMPRFKSLGKLVLVVFITLVLSGSVLTIPQKEAEATYCYPCWACGIGDCAIFIAAAEIFEELIFDEIILELIDRHFNYEEEWIVDVFFEELWVKGLAEMTHYLSAFGMYQVYVVGTFFDAKAQLETRRLFYTLQAEAHRDYYPSEDFCWFGTNARSLVASEQSSLVNHLALTQKSLKRRLGNQWLAASSTSRDDKDARWRQFVNTYCDPKDNDWSSIGTGLDLACDRDGLGGSAATGALNSERMNRDVDFTRLIDEPRTLDVNFTDLGVVPPPAPPALTDDGEDVLAMATNLYGHKSLGRELSRQVLVTETGQKLYYSLRSVAAKRGITENTFNTIVSMKSSGTNGPSTPPGTVPEVGRFMAALIRDLALPVTNPPATAAALADHEQYILDILGENPSYYAQLEFLAKKIYQTPEFFANLYDTPANVERKSVAMKAVELMLDRALLESELRQEMLLSVLLTNELRQEFKKINADFQ